MVHLHIRSIKNQFCVCVFSSVVEMPRIRKDSETLSNCGYSTISRTRRESDRLRSDLNQSDNPYAAAPRNISNSSMIREVCEGEERLLISSFFRL